MNVNSTKVTVFGRFSYAHVFEPQASNNGGDPKYSTSIIIDKDDKETIKAIETAVQNAINGGVGKFGGRIPSNLHKPLRDGDEEKPDDPAYAHAYFLNASCKTKPGVFRRETINGQKSYIQLTEEEFYSGCYGFASLNFFPYNTNGNRGIGANLNNILKTREGDYLGGRSTASADFDGLDAEENVPE